MNIRFKIIQSRVQFIQNCDKFFHLSVITLFPNTYFLTSSLLRLLNNFLEWSLLLPLYRIQKICVNSIASKFMCVRYLGRSMLVCLKSVSLEI